MSTPITATGTGTTGASQGVTNPGAAIGSNEFLQLLMAQMQNQDPMDPMNNDQSITEMAQFSTVQEITNLSQSMTQQGFQNQISQSVALIGHTVGYLDANGAMQTGVASAVSVDQASDTVSIDVGGTAVDPSQIVSVS